MGAVLGVVDSVLGVVDSHDTLLPHNLTACVISGRPPHDCRHFHLFNFSRCAASPPSYATVLPTVSRCLNESGCVPLYDVPLCVERYNLSAAAFNHTECVAFVEATNATLRPNATGCDGLLPSNATHGRSASASAGPSPASRYAVAAVHTRASEMPGLGPASADAPTDDPNGA